MLNISKNGSTIYILYGSKNYANGRTVTAAVLNGSNAAISGSPFTLTEIGSTGMYGTSFTPTVNGEYKIQITENSTLRAHANIKITDHDIESVGGDVTSIKNLVEGANGLAAIKSAVDANQADLTTIEGKVDTIDGVVDGNASALTDIKGSGFSTGSDSLKSIKDYLVNTIQSAISSIQNNTRTTIALPGQMLRPATGSSVFKIYANVYDADGNMEDPDDQDAGAEQAMIEIQVVDESGNDRSSNLAGLSASTQDSKDWMTRDAQGRFSATYSVANTHDLEQLIFTFNYIENSNPRTVDRSSIVTSSLSIEDDVDTILSEIQSATYGLSAIKTLLDIVDANTDTLEAGQTTIEGKIDTVDTVVDGIATDLTTIEGKIDTIDTVVDGNASILANGTYGLAALKTLIDNIQTTVNNIDLSNVEGVGYVKADDSLKAISDRQQAIQGTGWNASTDNLHEIKQAIDGIDSGNGGYIS